MRGDWVRKVVPIAIILNAAAIGVWWRNRSRSALVKQPAPMATIPPAVPLVASPSISTPSLRAIAQVDNWRWGRQIAWGTWAELAMIGLWAMWVGRDFLNLGASIWPSGTEFGRAIQSHFIWQPLFTCGSVRDVEWHD